MSEGTIGARVEQRRSLAEALPRILTDGRARWLAAGLVALPMLLAVASVAGRTWTPTSDQALEVLRTLDVGRDTPLTGVYSRFGWDHPGPLLFWVGAPFTHLLGATGLLVTAGLVNTVAGAGAVLAAWRRGGALLGWLVAAAIAVMVHTIGSSTVVDPWNPYLLPLPLLAYLLCVWGASEGDGPLLAGAVVAGSWCVQLHVGTAVVVVVAAAFAAGRCVLARRAGTPVPARTWVLASVLLGVALWSGPLLDQLFGSGNLGEIVQAQLDERDEELVGWEPAVGAAGVQFGIPAAWMGADDMHHGYARTGSFAGAAVVFAAGAVAGLAAWARGRRAPASLVALALVLAAASVFAISRISGFLAFYLVRWAWAVAALLAVATVWAAVLAAGSRGAGRLVVLGAFVLALAFAAATPIRTLPASTPDPVPEGIAAALLEQIRERIDPDVAYRFSLIDARSLGAVSAGIVVALLADGYSLDLPPGFEHPFKRSGIDAPSAWTLQVVARIDGIRWTPPPGARLIAAHDPLAPAERREAIELEARMRARFDLDPARVVDLQSSLAAEEFYGGDDDAWRLHELQRSGDRFTVWLLPPQG